MRGATDYTLQVWFEIEQAVRKAERDLGRGVMARDIVPRMPYRRVEGSLRRDMAQMAQHGRLVRLGGAERRQGYRLPTPVERLSWSINGGRWPLGTESARAA